MRKSIKLEEQVYQRLEAIRGKRENFSQVVGRLLTIIEAFQTLPLRGPEPTSTPKVEHAEE